LISNQTPPRIPDEHYDKPAHFPGALMRGRPVRTLIVSSRYPALTIIFSG
jgi:hypothetical protein